MSRSQVIIRYSYQVLAISLFSICTHYIHASDLPGNSSINTSNAVNYPITNTNTFDQITALAINLEKNQSWDNDYGKKAIAALGNDQKLLRFLNGVHKLLDEDVTGISDIFKNRREEPDTMEVDRSRKILLNCPYTMAANALAVVDRGMNQGDRVKAWLSIPPEKRKPIDEYMRKRYPEGGQENLRDTVPNKRLPYKNVKV